jgi:hypothetical protein
MALGNLQREFIWGNPDSVAISYYLPIQYNR